MSVIMSNKNIPNNGVKEVGTSYEGLSRQVFPGSRNQATTDKTPLNADNEDNVMVLGGEEWEHLFGNNMETISFNGFSCESSNEDDIDIKYNNKERRTWTKTLNTAVMECYFLSRPVDEEGKPVIGYRRRMHNIWKERYHTEITKQRLCDQVRMIRKNEWITKLKLKNIKRKVLQKGKDIEVNNNDNTGKLFHKDEENIHENEATQVDTENLGEEEKTMIQDILDLVKDNSRIELRGFNKIDRRVLAEWSRKINCILKHIRTENITDTNILIKAAIVYVGKKIGLKACGSKKKGVGTLVEKKDEKIDK